MYAPRVTTPGTRQNGLTIYAARPTPVPSFPVLSVTRDQRALLNRFGLRGDARNEATIRAHLAAERPGSNAYRAVRLSRALTSGTFGMRDRGEGREQRVARALAASAASRMLPPARRLRYDKIAYNQKLAAINRRSPANRQKLAGQRRATVRAFRAQLASARARAPPRDKREQLRRLAGRIWDALQKGSRLARPPSSLEQRVYATLRQWSQKGNIEGIIKALARRDFAKDFAKDQVDKRVVSRITEAVSLFAVSAAACAFGPQGWMTRAGISVILMIPARHLRNKVSIAIEKTWDGFVARLVDPLVERLPAIDVPGATAAAIRGGKTAATKARAALVGLVEWALEVEVPRCATPLVVSSLMRAFINTQAEISLGVQLDYVAMTAALTKHVGAIEKLLAGDPKVNLKPLVLDLVTAVPEAQIDAALGTLGAKYAGWIGGSPKA